MQDTSDNPLSRLFANLDSFLFGLSIIMIVSGMIGIFFMYQEQALSSSQDVRSQAQVAPPDTDPPEFIGPPDESPPPGCHYEVVQCVQAPCPPLLVCEPKECEENPDLTGDGMVGIEDYTILNREFFQELDEYTADINCDDAVDIRDYSIMARSFSILN